MITENQDRFVQMLNEPLTESGSGLGAEGQSPPAAGGAPAVVGQNPESGYIQVTPEEKQAVERVLYNFHIHRHLTNHYHLN